MAAEETIESLNKTMLLSSSASMDNFNKIDSLIGKMMEKPPLSFDPGDQIWAISDIHVDCAPNMNWIKRLPNYKSDTLIVAGDVCTSLQVLRNCFVLLKEKFKHVFFIPGNHELWSYAGGPNSVDKLYQILLLCEELGVHITPSDLGSDISIVPIFSWWQVENDLAIVPKIVAEFDGNCNWPPEIGDPDNIHNSAHPGIAEFFLKLNQRALRQQQHYKNRPFVITYSHFVPEPVHCESVPRDFISFLCCPSMLNAIEDLQSRVHVFGHSHVNTDVKIKGTRFVQNALGHTKPTEFPPCDMNLVAVGLNSSRVSPLELLPPLEDSPKKHAATTRNITLSPTTKNEDKLATTTTSASASTTGGQMLKKNGKVMGVPRYCC